MDPGDHRSPTRSLQGYWLQFVGRLRNTNILRQALTESCGDVDHEEDVTMDRVKGAMRPLTVALVRDVTGWVEKGVLFVRVALMGPTRALPGDQKWRVEGRQRRSDQR